MRIRLGFVAMTLRLEDCSPSKTVTLKNIDKIDNYQDQTGRLARIGRENLLNTLRILRANQFDRIGVYRFTSKLIPLCTHPHFTNWDYCQELRAEFQAIGEFVKEHQLRVSMHPDHFTLLNSPIPEVLESSLRDLDYHSNVLETMGLGTEAKLVIHVGGKYDHKTNALERFKQEFHRLPLRIKDRLIIENDDRCFTAADVLQLCQEISAPMVLDLHHHHILNHGEELSGLLPQIFATWEDSPPKVHLSSPRDHQHPRNHADYIQPEAAAAFINSARTLGQDFDIMLEAKQKDLALIRLSNDLKALGFPVNGSAELIFK